MPSVRISNCKLALHCNHLTFNALQCRGMCRLLRFTYAYPYTANGWGSLRCNVGLTCNLKMIEIRVIKSVLHDEELVDVSSLTWSEYFLIMRLHVPYVVFTLYSSIYMTMTTRCRNYDTPVSWLWKLCVITMWRACRGYEKEGTSFWHTLSLLYT